MDDFIINADGSVLYKMRTKAGEAFDILYDSKGYPVFDSLHDMTLKSSDVLKDYTVHFKRASEDLYAKAMQNPDLKKMFTDAELDLFKDGLKPSKYKWHHHQDTGKMQLVLTKFHDVAQHTGGYSIWGKGY